MLSKKAPGSGMLTVAAGIDRGRVGERLHAALAGLQELHFLKEKQADMVHWALRMDREESTGPCQSNTNPNPVYAEEQRLEATLTALKQQLTRLRRQDVGLKTHLQQLDQQISELKLDVCKASTEHLESDSRPSSGFYELSDGGSGSLSNSCTSVYSACLSSSSQSNLQAFYTPNPAVNEASRRRSADEPMAHPDPPRGTGIRLGSSRLRTGMPGSERGRQRPVSTGDLERMMTPGVGYGKSADVRTSPLSSNLRNVNADVRYQSSLVSRGGTEVYRYPSPLHAVALQSPIFYLSANPPASLPTENHEPQEGAAAFSSADPEVVGAKPETAQVRPVGYINKILQRSTSKLNILNENAPVMEPLSSGTPHSLVASAQDMERGQLGKMHTPIFFQESTMLSNNYLGGNENPKMYYHHSQGNCVTSSAGVNSNKKEPAEISHSNHTSTSRELKSSKTVSNVEVVGSLTRDGPNGNPCERNGQETRKRSSSKPPERRPKVATASEDTRAVPSEFVHAQFVPAGTQHVKIQQADKKTKAVRLRKRSCDKPRGSKHLQKHSSREREREASAKLRVERNSKSSAVEKGLAMRSASEFSIPRHPCLCCSSCSSLASTNQAMKCGKACRPYQPSLEHLGHDQGGGRRRPCPQKYLSASEARLSQPTSHSHRPREVLIHSPGRRSGVRPQSGHWGGVASAAAAAAAASTHRPSLRPSVSVASYFNQMDARYPPAPRRGPSGGRYPPRCESEVSEYSAECASLFHSTIAESSEGEVSDYTTNRFGDSESSQGSQSNSESDSSLSLDEDELEEEEGEGEEGGLVWAEAALGPTAAGLPLPQAEPSACRIKASRALKKKIRRFQPASLKVMTLV
ncbi:dapper homolog 2 [Sardina pilchardus]|uniref:dapper homolog 2 n=1 Tax=Sardina pilchardus TaxID=27697 RepID=UPI002E0F9C47